MKNEHQAIAAYFKASKLMRGQHFYGELLHFQSTVFACIVQSFH